MSTAWETGHKGQHSDLHKMCVFDTQTGTRIIPNSKPILIDNECYTGEVLLLIRTPDVDEKKKKFCKTPSLSSSPTHPMAQQVSEYLSGRQRRFEFQFRIRFKKAPTGPIFLGCEVEQPIQLGRVTKSLTSFLLAMIRRINSGFHYSWGDDQDDNGDKAGSGDYEKTHLSFPVEASMDRIVITKPGETPPPLGGDLPESDASVKRRRKLGAGSIQWNTTDTYTMCLWSAYVDWIQWKCMNVVGIRPFPLGTILGTQPIYLSVYEIQNISNEEYKAERPPHKRNQLSVYSRMEFSHISKTVGGMSDMLGNHSDPNCKTLDSDDDTVICDFQDASSEEEKKVD